MLTTCWNGLDICKLPAAVLCTLVRKTGRIERQSSHARDKILDDGRQLTMVRPLAANKRLVVHLRSYELVQGTACGVDQTPHMFATGASVLLKRSSADLSRVTYLSVGNGGETSLRSNQLRSIDAERYIQHLI